MLCTISWHIVHQIGVLKAFKPKLNLQFWSRLSLFDVVVDGGATQIARGGEREGAEFCTTAAAVPPPPFRVVCLSGDDAMLPTPPKGEGDKKREGEMEATKDWQNKRGKRSWFNLVSNDDQIFKFHGTQGL